MKELLDKIEDYKLNKINTDSIKSFKDALFNGKVIWFIKSDKGPVENEENYKPLYDLGAIVPGHELIHTADVGTWDVLGVTESGKLVNFKGQTV